MKLSAGTLLDLWERELPPAERAVAALAAWDGEHGATPTMSDAEHGPATLPLDELNRRLLDMRAAAFGEALAFYAECPRCGEAIEFEVAVSSLLDTAGPGGNGSFDFEGVTIECRPPTTVDIVAATTSHDARRTLLERCVVRAASGSVELAAADLPDAAAAAVEAFLDEHHPLLDITFAIACSACGHAWSELLDVAAHVWDDIDSRARRLLGEVALLARSYGWSESEVLGMTTHRRAHYLELLG